MGPAVNSRGLQTNRDEIRQPSSLRNMQGQCHAAVARTAEDGAMANERADFIRREGGLAGLALAYLDFYAKLLESDAVRDVRAFQHQYDWLALLQGDFTGREFEPLGRNFDPVRGRLRTDLWNAHERCD